MCPGAIELATTCTRGAKRIAELARDDSDNEGQVTASSAFAAAQKKVRVTGATGDQDPSEINIKIPGRSSGADDSEELHNILFGGEARGSTQKEKGGSDEEQQEKKRKVQRNISKGKKLQPATPAGHGADGSDAQSSDPVASSWGMSIGTSKKAASESKELDKAESLILTVSQLKGQLQDESSVLNVSLKAVRSLSEKVSTRLNQEGTKFFVEAVRRCGSNSRAAQVWQNMKDSKACLEACT